MFGIWRGSKCFVILDYDIDNESLSKDYNRIRQQIFISIRKHIFIGPLTFVDFIQNPFVLKRLGNARHML